MTRYRNTKRVTQPCRVVVGSSGVVSMYVPFNEEFLTAFKNTIHKDDRHYNPDRKVWQIKPEVLASAIETLQQHFSKIEGLDALIESPFDTLKITPDAPDELVKYAAKTLRAKYHPDRIHIDNYKELWPHATTLDEARNLATDYLQEIGEAEKLIVESRREDV